MAHEDGADNEIGDEGACALGDALKENPTLTELNLEGGKQGHKEAQQERAKQAQRHVV